MESLNWGRPGRWLLFGCVCLNIVFFKMVSEFFPINSIIIFNRIKRKGRLSVVHHERNPAVNRKHD